jgi:hypothetical protein
MKMKTGLKAGHQTVEFTLNIAQANNGSTASAGGV